MPKISPESSTSGHIHVLFHFNNAISAVLASPVCMGWHSLHATGRWSTPVLSVHVLMFLTSWGYSGDALSTRVQLGSTTRMSRQQLCTSLATPLCFGTARHGPKLGRAFLLEAPFHNLAFLV